MQTFSEWWGTIQWADFSVGAVLAALITGVLGSFAHVYNKRAALQAQRNQFEHDLRIQREQLRHSDSSAKVDIVEKFIRALKAAYKDLDQYKGALDGEKANGRHVRYYSERQDVINADKFENYRGESIDKRLELSRSIDQHLEELESIQLKITGIAPEYRNDAKDAISQFKGHHGTLYLLPEGQSLFNHYDMDEGKWNNILANIKGTQ